MKTLVEGLALGTLAVGVSAVSSSKLDLEFAIGHALRRWSRASDFPALAGQAGPNYVWIGLGNSERREGLLAAWRDGRWREPYVKQEGWSVEDCTNLLSELGGVSHASWVELARLFVDHLGADRTRRI